MVMETIERETAQEAVSQQCQWFALCRNEAVGTVEHPVLGSTPICQRCADRMNLTLTRLPQ